MRDFVIRVIISAVGIAIVAAIIPGIQVQDTDITTLLVIGLIFGVVNAVIRPIVSILTCPFVILTLGLFILVINGAMLMLTANFAGDRLTVDGWLAAILGGIVMSIVMMILEGFMGLRDSDEPQDMGRKSKTV